MLIYSIQVIILDQTSSAKVKLRSSTDIDRICVRLLTVSTEWQLSNSVTCVQFRQRNTRG